MWKPALRWTPESNYWRGCRWRPYSNYWGDIPPGFDIPAPQDTTTYCQSRIEPRVGSVSITDSTPYARGSQTGVRFRPPNPRVHFDFSRGTLQLELNLWGDALTPNCGDLFFLVLVFNQIRGLNTFQIAEKAFFLSLKRGFGFIERVINYKNIWENFGGTRANL